MHLQLKSYINRCLVIITSNIILLIFIVTSQWGSIWVCFNESSWGHMFSLLMQACAGGRVSHGDPARTLGSHYTWCLCSLQTPSGARDAWLPTSKFTKWSFIKCQSCQTPTMTEAGQRQPAGKPRLKPAPLSTTTSYLSPSRDINSGHGTGIICPRLRAE